VSDPVRLPLRNQLCRPVGGVDDLGELAAVAMNISADAEHAC
jgi:hypothetical protein